MGLEAAQDNPAFQEISAAVEAAATFPKPPASVMAYTREVREGDEGIHAAHPFISNSSTWGI
jgi:hypothetical protein